MKMEVFMHELIEEKEKQIKNMVETAGRVPTMTIFQVVGDDASDIYVRNKIKKLNELGIEVKHVTFAKDETLECIEHELMMCSTDGSMLQLPLPDHLKEHEQKLLDTILSTQDVDQLSTVSKGRLMNGEIDILPCTVQAVIDIIKKDLGNMDGNIDGVDVLIFGRSKLVGLPLSVALTHMNAEPTIIHSKSGWGEYTSSIIKHYNNNYVVSAVGKEGFLKTSMFYDGDTVIDVGINRDANGKICGDFEHEDDPDKTVFYTPVPGGVGKLTVLNVAGNLLKLMRKY